MNKKSVAVVISDVHYDLKTYKIADTAFRAAIDKAHELGVSLIDDGDLTSDKALLRAEVIKTITDTFKYAQDLGVKIYCNVGNHSRWSEKDPNHALTFLEPYATIINHPTSVDGFNFIPYQSSSEAMLEALAKFPKGSLIFCHQGLQGAFMGDYQQDKTSLPPEAYADYCVVSGHYHRAQTIKCGRPRKGAVGLYSFVGNPYTLTFGEANDGEKGFQILWDDGTLTQVPTNLRKHWNLDFDLEGLEIFIDTGAHPKPGDLVWIKLRGPVSELAKIKKTDVMARLGLSALKFDKLPTETEHLTEEEKAEKKAQTGAELLDALIDKSDEPAAQKVELKGLWRDLVSSELRIKDTIGDHILNKMGVINRKFLEQQNRKTSAESDEGQFKSFGVRKQGKSCETS